MAGDVGQRERAARRASWPNVRATLAEEVAPPVATLDGAARVAMVWAVTLDAWTSSGLPMPGYERASMPGRILRGTRADR